MRLQSSKVRDFSLFLCNYSSGAFLLQARKKSTKINFLCPETARWGGGLPREGVVAEKFVLSLEGLSSLGFEERNYVFPIGELFWYKISAFSHRNPCLQALCKLFSSECLTIDLSSHDKGCCKSSLGSVLDPT